MISILEYIKDIFMSIVNLVVMLVKSLVQAFLFLPNIISSFTESVAYLPAVLALFASLGITFMVINYVIGRK